MISPAPTISCGRRRLADWNSWARCASPARAGSGHWSKSSWPGAPIRGRSRRSPSTAPFAVTLETRACAERNRRRQFRARAGVFPLRRYAANGDGADQWSLWASRAEQAALAAGFPKPIAAGIIGAMGELQDNVLRHSRRSETGLAAYASSDWSLRARHRRCRRRGAREPARMRRLCAPARRRRGAKVAVEDGNIRLGRGSGNGFGMGQMFRALANHDGELRFRSGDHALAVRGHSPSLQGHVELGHKARLGGMTISVLCRAPVGRSRGGVTSGALRAAVCGRCAPLRCFGQGDRRLARP